MCVCVWGVHGIDVRSCSWVESRCSGNTQQGDPELGSCSGRSRRLEFRERTVGVRPVALRRREVPSGGAGRGPGPERWCGAERGMGAKDSLGVKSFRAGDQTWCPRESAVAKLILGLLGRVSQRRHDCDRVSQSGRRSRAGGIPVSRAAGMPVPAARLPCDRVMCPAPSPPKKMPDLSHTQPMGTREPRHRSWGRSGWEFQTPTRGSKVCLALRSVWAARRLSHCASSPPPLALLLQVFLFLLDSSQLALLTLPAGTKHYAPPLTPGALQSITFMHFSSRHGACPVSCPTDTAPVETSHLPDCRPGSRKGRPQPCRQGGCIL